MEYELIAQLATLLEKSGISSGSTFASADRDRPALETMLTEAKALNARYDRSDALAQVQWLMNQHHIQIDEVLEGITR